MEVTLRRIVVGYRVIAAVWMVTLAAITLSEGTAEEPRFVVGAMAVVVAWTGLTLLISFRAPQMFAGWSFVAADILVNAVLLVMPDLAGSANFMGGYSTSAVLFAVYGVGLAGGVAAVVVLVSVVLYQINGGYRSDITDPTVLSSTVLVYPFIAVPVTWGIGALRRSDRMRREAEADLEQARADQVRAEERSSVAEHLHDSVLQTLALIQRNSSDPEEVVSLARSQERDLRSWLFGGGSEPDSFEGAVLAAGAEVETSYRVPIDVVVVGDGEMSEGLRALVAASKEAMVNAAKHSMAPTVAVYAEIEDDLASIFVRDRGVGFDAESVPPNRHGIASSIVARMERHGGESEIASKPSAGTEVRLKMSR